MGDVPPESFGDDGEDLLKLFRAPSIVFLIYLLGNIINELSYSACGDVHCYLFRLWPSRSWFLGRSSSFFSLTLRLRLFLFWCSFVGALACFPRLELGVAVKTLGAGVGSALATLFLATVRDFTWVKFFVALRRIASFSILRCGQAACPVWWLVLLHVAHRFSASLFGHSFRECSLRHVGHLILLAQFAAICP